MPTLHEQFKGSFISGVFNLSGRLWWKYAIVTFIQSFVSGIAALPLLISVFDFDAFKGIIEDPEGWGQQIEQQPELLFSFIGPDPDFSGLIIAGSFLLILSVLVQAWMSHIFFLLNDSEVGGRGGDLGEAFTRSFRPGMFRILGVSLVLLVVYLAIIALSAFIGYSVHPAVAVILGFLGLIFILRFILALPAVVHADAGVGDSINQSFAILSWRRSFLLFLAIIAAVISLSVALSFIFFFGMLISLIPLLGAMIFLLMNFVINGFVNALIYGSMSGLFFRYSDLSPTESQEDDLGRHLIDKSEGYTN